VYAVALSVASCLRAGTRVDVAWRVDAAAVRGADPTAAVALTPGGGRIGDLLGGVLDDHLADLAGRSAGGRLVDVTIGPSEALLSGLPAGGTVRCAIVPASALPGALWPQLLRREAVVLASRLEGDSLVRTDVYDGSAGDDRLRALVARGPGAWTDGDRMVTVLRPITRLVVFGQGEIAEALRQGAAMLGWLCDVIDDPDQAAGLMAALSPIDGVVVMGHEVEPAGRVLAAALDGDAGYIGALGGRRMQEARRDWLAYRGYTDVERIHGPAGLDIGATGPAEVAVSILAEAIAAHRSAS
jgi:xanthine dehydrogenase accessory factor